MSLTNIGLVCTASNYMVVTIPATLFALYWIQKFYLRTSKQIRLLDLEVKSPLYKRFTETVEGISAIRAFGWQPYFNKAALDELDVSQKPYYILYCVQSWLGLVLDFTVAAMGIVVVTLALRLPGSSGGSMGVALTSILGLNSNLQTLITSWTQALTNT